MHHMRNLVLLRSRRILKKAEAVNAPGVDANCNIRHTPGARDKWIDKRKKKK